MKTWMDLVWVEKGGTEIEGIFEIMKKFATHAICLKNSHLRMIEDIKGNTFKIWFWLKFSGTSS
jgi:hypothetical protein